MTQTTAEKIESIDERAVRYQQCAVNIIRELQSRKRMNSREQVVLAEYVSRLASQAMDALERTDILTQIDEPDAVKALVEFHDARISELAAQRTAESAERRTSLGAQQLALMVEDLTGTRLGDHFGIDEISLEVYRKNEDRPKVSDWRQISLMLATATPEQIKRLAAGQACEDIGALLNWTRLLRLS